MGCPSLPPEVKNAQADGFSRNAGLSLVRSASCFFTLEASLALGVFYDRSILSPQGWMLNYMKLYESYYMIGGVFQRRLGRVFQRG